MGVAACGSEGDDVGNPESNLSIDEATAPLEGASPELTARPRRGERAARRRHRRVRGPPRRAARARRSSSTSGRRGAGHAAPSSPTSSPRRPSAGAEVAFLGVGSNDSEDALATFLEQLPLPYPSYLDPDQEIAKELGGTTSAFPATAFYDSSGELVFTHNGLYSSEEDLAAEIDRYAK